MKMSERMIQLYGIPKYLMSLPLANFKSVPIEQIQNVRKHLNCNPLYRLCSDGAWDVSVNVKECVCESRGICGDIFRNTTCQKRGEL